MKSFLSAVLLILIGVSSINAQIKITEVIKEVKPIELNTTIAYDLLDVEVFEQSNYSGKSGRFRMENGKLIPPFKPMKNVSFKLPAGKIVYFKFCTLEFPYENAYASSQGKIDLSGVCGIRSDNVTTLPIQFNGLSTVIHNNDCRRVFGSVRIKIFETAPDGTSQSFMRYTSSTSFPGPDAFTFQPFANPNSSTALPYRNLLFDENRGVPSITTIVNSINGGIATGGFKVGASALAQGRVWVVVMSNIGSAHKTCDLCDDFSSNVKMAAPITESFPINKLYAGSKIVDATHNKIVLGPYQARGSRDGSAITASAGTFIDFRVHITVAGL
jgi:hypothetical protein